MKKIKIKTLNEMRCFAMRKIKDVNKIEVMNEKACELTELDFHELNQRSFYPPQDDRIYTSGIDDIDGGDNFAEYAEYFWEEYGHELYDDIEM